MVVFRYLAACAVAGVLVGRGFGVFARAPFHYPLRLDAVSSWHRALVNALDVVEWPSFFGLTAACALALWAVLPPRRSALGTTWPVRATACGSCAALAMLIAVPATNRPGRLLSALIAGVLGTLGAALLLALWREASRGRRSLLARWRSQLPLVVGHLVATSAAAMSLGYRGESALIHGIALLAGVAMFVVELLSALVMAVLASRRPASSPSAAP